MPLAPIFTNFKSDVTQCNSLIANAHQVDAAGKSLLPLADRKQITVAAFLNLYIAWETFLESSLTELMVGSPTLSGTLPVKYVAPVDLPAATALVIGVQRFFDYGNHDNMRRIVNMYFQHGYPFEPHLTSLSSDLSDLRTLRHASAHISSTTQTALESLALRIFGKPSTGIDLYSVLTKIDPRSKSNETVFEAYKNKLVVTGELIVNG